MRPTTTRVILIACLVLLFGCGDNSHPAVTKTATAAATGPGYPTSTPTPAFNDPPLQVHLNGSPFNFTVANAAGVVYVTERSLRLTINGVESTVTSATNIQQTTSSVDADLGLSANQGQAHVHFTYVQPGVVRVQYTMNNAVPSQIIETILDQGDHYYGLFEYPFNNSIDNRGVDHDLLGLGTMPGINLDDARAPFYMSSRGYALYFETQDLGKFTMGNNNQDIFNYTASSLTYDVIEGPGYDHMLARYNALAGGGFMPPLWAFDAIWWKDDDHADFHGSVQNGQENVLDTAIQLQHYQIPGGSEWIDRPYGTGFQGWGNFDFDSAFPNPVQMVKDVNGHGMQLMVWIANRAWNNLYTDANAQGLLFPNNNGSGSALDLRNPAAYAYFQSHLNNFVNLGIRGYKIDRGDEGEQPTTVQNQNINLFAKMATEGLQAGGPSWFIFARDAYDTGRKYVAVWDGDSQANFMGLQYSVSSGIKAGMISFPMWGSDTGGYLGGPPTKELFARWLEFSAYSPMMEILIGGGRTPWYNYDNQLIQITHDQVALHHDLIPYTQSMLNVANQTGMPIIRGLVLAYPDDPQVATINDEYLYGSELLVAPVVTAGATSRQVYLPAGKWINLADNSVVTGGQSITVPAPLAATPVFAREGAIIPRGDIVQTNNNWTPNWSPQLHIQIFPSATQSNDFPYYVNTNPGANSSPSTGIAHILVQPGAGATTVHVDNLGAPGTLEIYVKSVGAIMRNGSTLVAGKDYTFDATSHLLQLPFTGATTLTLNGAVSLFA